MTFAAHTEGPRATPNPAHAAPPPAERPPRHRRAVQEEKEEEQQQEEDQLLDAYKAYFVPWLQDKMPGSSPRQVEGLFESSYSTDRILETNELFDQCEALWQRFKARLPHAPDAVARQMFMAAACDSE